MVKRSTFSALTAAVFFWLSSLTVPAGALELVMFEQEGCEWCEIWDKDVGGLYHKTDEGKRAPLHRVDLFQERPSYLKDIRRVFYTPTFVLMDGNKEVGRILGYPGESHFWGLLGELLEKVPASDSKKAAKLQSN